MSDSLYVACDQTFFATTFLARIRGFSLLTLNLKLEFIEKNFKTKKNEKDPPTQKRLMIVILSQSIQ